MVADLVVLRVVVDLGASAAARHGDLDDLGDLGVRSVAHQEDLVGEQDGLVHIVRDHEHRLVRGLHDLQQLVLDGAAGQRIERAEGFVEQQHLGLDGEGARDADALLHAAREFRRLLVDRVAEADHFEVAGAVFGDLLFRPVRPLRFHGEGDVAQHAHPGHQGVALEYHAAVEAGPPDFAAVHEGLAGTGFVEPGQHVEDGGLAAAGVADDADELALVDVEVDVLEHRFVGNAIGRRKDLLQVFDGEEMRAHFVFPLIRDT